MIRIGCKKGYGSSSQLSFAKNHQILIVYVGRIRKKKKLKTIFNNNFKYLIMR